MKFRGKAIRPNANCGLTMPVCMKKICAPNLMAWLPIVYVLSAETCRVCDWIRLGAQFELPSCW